MEAYGMDVTNGRGYVYSIQYHIVWCVKYRHKVLEGQVEKRLIEILKQIAVDNGFDILEIMIKAMKGKSLVIYSERNCGEGTCGIRPILLLRYLKIRKNK